MEDEFKDLLVIEPTDRKHTFLLDFDWSGYYYSKNTDFDYDETQDIYHGLVRDFVQEMRELGLTTAKLKKGYLYGIVYYITFRSVHDAMAFKLTWS